MGRHQRGPTKEFKDNRCSVIKYKDLSDKYIEGGSNPKIELLIIDHFTEVVNETNLIIKDSISLIFKLVIFKFLFIKV